MDIVERAKTARALVLPHGTWAVRGCTEMYEVLPELVAEVERLRAGGPWVEHVERMEAMKRTRDGGCICDVNPETTNGPDEFCPWHGRTYRELVEGLESQAAEIERLRAENEAMQRLIRNPETIAALDRAEESDPIEVEL